MVDMRILTRAQELMKEESSQLNNPINLIRECLETVLRKERDRSLAVAIGVYFSSPFGTSLKP